MLQRVVHASHRVASRRVTHVVVPASPKMLTSREGPKRDTTGHWGHRKVSGASAGPRYTAGSCSSRHSTHTARTAQAAAAAGARRQSRGWRAEVCAGKGLRGGMGREGSGGPRPRGGRPRPIAAASHAVRAGGGAAVQRLQVVTPITQHQHYLHRPIVSSWDSLPPHKGGDGPFACKLMQVGHFPFPPKPLGNTSWPVPHQQVLRRWAQARQAAVQQRPAVDARAPQLRNPDAVPRGLGQEEGRPPELLTHRAPGAGREHVRGAPAAAGVTQEELP